LKSALQKVLGEAALKPDNENDEDEEGKNSDLDDETMLKLDETIAQAFRARTNKDKEQQQKEIIQYKSRVLDFVQELFKSTHRLDLTTVCVS
jgi:polysaccharide pyruvyl transferase WcaK-like protein